MQTMLLFIDYFNYAAYIWTMQGFYNSVYKYETQTLLHDCQSAPFELPGLVLSADKVQEFESRGDQILLLPYDK